MCRAHYMQSRRGGVSTGPLRSRRTDTDLQLITARVSSECAAELTKAATAEGRSAYQVSSEILERWAKRRRKT